MTEEVKKKVQSNLEREWETKVILGKKRGWNMKGNPRRKGETEQTAEGKGTLELTAHRGEGRNQEAANKINKSKKKCIFLINPGIDQFSSSHKPIMHSESNSLFKPHLHLLDDGASAHLQCCWLSHPP